MSNALRDVLAPTRFFWELCSLVRVLNTSRGDQSKTRIYICDMKNSSRIRFSLSLLLLVTFLLPAVSLAAGDGKKYFKEGMKYEATDEWDKAAELFALAVTENPRNPEYRLHYQRSLFNASQMYMKKGRTAAEEGDYEGAYVAFRKAFAYDPVNELAKSEMARMVRLQEAYLKSKGSPQSTGAANGTVKVVPTAYGAQNPPDDFPMPQRLEKLRDVPFPSGVNLTFIVKELAKDLDLNVLFDVQSNLDTRQVRIELRNVTAAKALDYIFLQENLFFQKVGPRTILVANGLRRQNFQQLVLRTFYLANANPKDVKTIVQGAIPPQQGRSQTIVLEDAATNSLTVRDTLENIRLIERLIASLDKDRAEVVMDVAIYEVNKTDLLQLGNQIGNDATLRNLGGVGFPFARSGTTEPITSGIPFPGLGNSSIAVGLPISNISALQSKNNQKLIASTQIHAFNNEDSSARIGQRVPVRTSSFVTAANTSNNGVVSDVINYEEVGLTMKFKPIVFPNQDVQVAMEIDSNEVAGVAGSANLTPIFTERTIKGTARIQNNKTLLLASVAQGVENRGRSGLPLFGLIPVLGRLFTAPTKDNRQVDIVIAVTPRVIRAPAILPDDEIERPTGSIATPTTGSLEAMIIQEEREEYLAAARRLTNNANVQLPDRPLDQPEYVRTGSAPANGEIARGSEQAQPDLPSEPPRNPVIDALKLKPIDSSVKTLDFGRTSLVSQAESTSPAVEKAPAPTGENNKAAEAPFAKISFPEKLPELTVGEKARIPILIEGTSALRSAVLGIRFDNSRLVVRSVLLGDVLGGGQETFVNPFLNQNGKMFVSLKLADGANATSSGILCYIEVEAVQAGLPEFTFEKDVLNILTAEGKNIQVRF